MALMQGNQGQTGKQVGPNLTAGFGEFSDQLVTELLPRYSQMLMRNQIYTFGASNAALVAANAIATGVAAASQPIVGLWNPPNSGVYVLILKAFLNITTIAGTAVSPGGFMWLISLISQDTITNGSTPFSCKTHLQAGSQVKAFAQSTSLAGLTGGLTVVAPLGINTIQAAGPATAAPQPMTQGVEDVDGSWGVPPGGVLSLMNQLSTTTISVNCGLKWAELPLS